MLLEGLSSPLILRQDYAPPAYWIDTVDLCFDLEPAKTRVLNKMAVRRNPDMAVQPLRLDGEELNLSRVLVNGQGAAFKLEGNQLVLENLPDAFELEIFTTCYPAKNTKLMGLYVSQNTFFTQCEAEGFRRITYFLDRPDVMASYSVVLRADKAAYPVLLSNGNLESSGELDAGRHYARWVDPHKKPCYLFALVAGPLVCREQRITARSGTSHLLQVYVRPGDLDKTEHALQSLIYSVLWDEARFNLPLDLERFMIVATSDFNMGAMENKGLNIFNTKYVLANQATATDADFGNIESVVGHEYFHNWTGNRVTCRDWFQLSLKEGLTVFRDQEFSQDLCAKPSARAVKRIEDVRVLRTAQFAEDAGPMAHPVRPDSYVEISNFYTVTIYEKGAEVVRMMQTLVGREGFADGMALYFKRHDGQAVTCDDFAQAIADANPASDLARLLPQFKRWYSQAGTPRLKTVGHYDAASQTYTLEFSQHCLATAGQADKEPFVIPVSVGLLGADGKDMALQLEGEAAEAAKGSRLLVLTEAQQSFTFLGVASEPVPSILRGFTAPVVLDFAYTDAQLLHLLQHDSDAFNRWEAGHRLVLQTAIKLIAARAGTHWSGGPFDAQKEPFSASEGLVSDAKADHRTESPLDAATIQAMRQVLLHPGLDAAFKELVLTLPSESYMAEQLPSVDPQLIHAVRQAMRLQLATELQSDWETVFGSLHAEGSTCAFATDPVSTGRRALAGLALANLCLAATAQGNPVWPGKVLQLFKDASNMSDRLNALSALVVSAHPLATQALVQFHALFSQEALVIDKWFNLQAGSPDHNGHILPLVRQLMQHPDFSLRNPNRARSVISSFCANPAAFHRVDGAGYAFWKEQVIALDAINPQVAARLARALDRWSPLAEPYRSLARAAIAEVAERPGLSRDTQEVLGRALAG